MATKYLRQLNERMIKDSEEALSVARELVRDKVLLPQSLTDYTQILEYLRYADRNIVQADTAAKPLPTVEEVMAIWRRLVLRHRKSARRKSSLF